MGINNLHELICRLRGSEGTVLRLAVTSWNESLNFKINNKITYYVAYTDTNLHQSFLKSLPCLAMAHGWWTFKLHSSAQDCVAAHLKEYVVHYIVSLVIYLHCVKCNGCLKSGNVVDIIFTYKNYNHLQKCTPYLYIHYFNSMPIRAKVVLNR